MFLFLAALAPRRCSSSRGWCLGVTGAGTLQTCQCSWAEQWEKAVAPYTAAGTRTLGASGWVPHGNRPLNPPLGSPSGKGRGAVGTQRQRRGHLLRSVRCISLPAGVQPSGAAFSHADILSLSPRGTTERRGGSRGPPPPFDSPLLATTLCHG